MCCLQKICLSNCSCVSVVSFVIESNFTKHTYTQILHLVTRLNIVYTAVALPRGSVMVYGDFYPCFYTSFL